MKFIFCVLTLITHTLFAKEPIPLHISHAKTPQQLRWGLMGRRTLADNEGLLLHYSSMKTVSLWSFNCFIDLDVAFLDQNGKIVEMGFLKSYPELMDAHPPILSLKQIDAYSDTDPLITFFRVHALNASQPVQYALELPSGFFKQHDIKVNDQVSWGKKDAFIFFHN